MKTLKITIIGAGNVGTQLALVFHQSGHKIVQIWSRRSTTAQRLSSKINANPIKDISNLKEGSDIYLLCIPDEGLREMANAWPLKNVFVCHTSGSTDMRVLEAYSPLHGVLYPLQTFSTRKSLNFKKIPFCIEASTPEKQDLLFYLLRGLSTEVRYIDSPTRMAIHLAAVIACNFSNYMYVLAEELLQKHGFSFNILHPLIEETSSKAVKISPFHAQTGPARRKDAEIIQKHLSLLSTEPHIRQIYELITQNISRDFQ